jgi:hypothetical protein
VRQLVDGGDGYSGADRASQSASHCSNWLGIAAAARAVPVFAQAPKAPNAPREDLTIDPETITQSWKGDLDQLVERRIVRVLVVPSKTFYFNDRGTQRGITHKAFQLVAGAAEADSQEKKPKRKHLSVRLFFGRPCRRYRGGDRGHGILSQPCT